LQSVHAKKITKAFDSYESNGPADVGHAAVSGARAAAEFDSGHTALGLFLALLLFLNILFKHSVFAYPKTDSLCFEIARQFRLSIELY
jgi:hypothetical protein